MTATISHPDELAKQLYWDKNSWIHLAFIVLTIAAVIAFGPLGLFVYLALHLLSDLLYYGFAVQVFDPSVTIQRGYQISLDFNDTPFAEGLDYGFNFYNGDFEKTRSQAQLDKFDYVYDQLALAPGMTLMDVGCGCGDWLSYLQDRGVIVTGINITWEQVEVCRSRNLNVYWSDWKDIEKNPELAETLHGSFDRVTFWDTVEHYVPLKYNFFPEKQDEIYSSMFAFAARLLKDESDGKVFISCLHTRHRFKSMKMNWALAKKAFYVYMLDKFHSGSYPSATKDCLVRNSTEHFELESRKDLTEDYYMTSVLEPTHFGRHKFKWTPRRAFILAWLIVSDPFWVQRYFWFLDESWMDQFDSESIDNSDMILYWLQFRRRPAAVS